MAKFIAFEGIDGSGKTSQLEYIGLRTRNSPTHIVRTYEPGSTAIGSALRSALLSHNDMHPYTQMMLMTAARVEHCAKVIEPSLNAGTHVLCDRYVDSTYAYQGAQGVYERDITLAHNAGKCLWPDLIILFDLPLEVAMSRIKHKTPDRYEAKGLDYLRKVQSIFRWRAASYPWGTYVVIDAGQDFLQVSIEVRSALAKAGVDVP